MSKDRDEAGFGDGFLAGVFVTFFALALANLYFDFTKSFDRYDCRKKYDVFSCEMIAVPVDPARVP